MTHTILTHEEAARFLKVTPQTLSKRVGQYGIPRNKFGREWRYVEEDLVAYVRGARIDHAPEQSTRLPLDQSGRVLHHRGIYSVGGGRR